MEAQGNAMILIVFSVFLLQESECILIHHPQQMEVVSHDQGI
jgi:hypothetical protein